ncbi:unannotated protein [freshwater metagenome]|uniref:Unannotated protein n=1 Tax=freshwater metagenome TaxID=449393 RepID=A0A6J6B7H9_9ZZZZ
MRWGLLECRSARRGERREPQTNLPMPDRNLGRNSQKQLITPYRRPNLMQTQQRPNRPRLWCTPGMQGLPRPHLRCVVSDERSASRPWRPNLLPDRHGRVTLHLEQLKHPRLIRQVLANQSLKLLHLTAHGGSDPARPSDYFPKERVQNLLNSGHDEWRSGPLTFSKISGPG